jgi:hypothetical protein
MGTSGASGTLVSISPNITTSHTGSGRGANSGFDLGIQGDYFNLNTGGNLKQLLPMAIECFIAGTSDSSGTVAVGTIQWETAPEPATTGGTLSYTLWGSAVAFTANGYQNTVGKMPTSAMYIRARITAYTSGYFTAYLRFV